MYAVATAGAYRRKKSFGERLALVFASVAVFSAPMESAVARPLAPVAAPGGGVQGLIDKGLISLATMFVNTGAGIASNRMIQAGTAPKYIGWGIGTNAAALGDTALQTESAPTSTTRITGSESRTTITNTNDNYQVVGTVTAGGTLAITEGGLFDAATAGTLFIRSVFAAVNVVSGDSIAFTFGLKFVPN